MGIFSKLGRGFGSGLLASQEKRRQDEQKLRSKRLSSEVQQQEEARQRKLRMGVTESLELGDAEGANKILEAEGEL